MDFFEILIYLFIIFSILSPLFKKKGPKTPETPQQEQQQHPPVSRQTMKTDQEEYDILKEIEMLFKTDTSVEPEISSKGTAIEQKIEEERKMTSIQRESEKRKPRKVPAKGEFTSDRTHSEHVYTDWNRKVKVDDSVARKAAAFTEMMNRRKDVVRSDNIQRIYSNIRNPETLKDYIIFAEILGKPKFRRR
jgi:hypothetical protein